jgi:Domain of unknown function (DUF4275)
VPRRHDKLPEPCIGFAALVQQGADVTPLSTEETEALQRRWRATFGAALAKAANVPLSDSGGFDWHIFSYGLVRALEGDEALAAYSARNHSELVVLPHRSKLLAARCRCRTVPQLDDASDVYICPDNFAWTMVFTHEKGWFGPYFCKAAWTK